jgi:hypothetical protein
MWAKGINQFKIACASVKHFVKSHHGFGFLVGMV